MIVGADETTLDGFTITGGEKFYDGSPSPNGSGLRCVNVEMSVKHCVFFKNGSKGILGGPLPVVGGAIYCINSNLLIHACIFISNTGSEGGAVFSDFNGTRSNLRVENSLFDKNAGTAYRCMSTNSVFINCTFGLFNQEMPNGSDFFGSGSLQVVNSILKGIIPGPLSPTNFTNSNSPGTKRLNGNIDADPLFVDAANGDYRLRRTSPCVDTGTRVDLFTDLDGNPRPIDVPGRGGSGFNSYDMGCYEYQGGNAPPDADIDKDGHVGTSDLLLLQQQWGEKHREAD